MQNSDSKEIEEAKKAAVEVLLHNSHGPFHGLPRTAGWGYPEPYTRDLMFSILGIAVSENQILIKSIRKVLETLANNQTQRGHITSLVHDPENRGSSDSTPLFLLAAGIFRHLAGESAFLEAAITKALIWMEYQSPSDHYLVAQQPTSDWRDEQWVIGHGLYVNAIVYSYLRILGFAQRAEKIRHEMNRLIITGDTNNQQYEGFLIKHKPYYALWTYKIHNSQRFDLLGNSIAILSGIASPARANDIISWIEDECLLMKTRGELHSDLPPNFFPFIKPEDPDWHNRYELYNKPGEYHNGGIWPFICGFYIAALVAAKRYSLAEKKLMALTQLIKQSNTNKLKYGYNEWFKSQNGKPMGQDWQSWSAALYLYAAKCVEQKNTPFFDVIRESMKSIKKV
jgi:glycogen debranching enzyme